MAKGGNFIKGKRHSEGGIPLVVKETGQKIEVEVGEPLISADAMDNSKVKVREGKNIEILHDINTEAGAKGMDKQATEVHAGDAIICRNAALDKDEHIYVGTDKQIVSAINQSGGCNTIESGGKEIDKNGKVIKQYKKGGKTDDCDCKHDRVSSLVSRLKKKYPNLKVEFGKGGEVETKKHLANTLSPQQGNTNHQMQSKDNNSNEKSKLNPVQKKIVNSREFRLWFGNWSNENYIEKIFALPFKRIAKDNNSNDIDSIKERIKNSDLLDRVVNSKFLQIRFGRKGIDHCTTYLSKPKNRIPFLSTRTLCEVLSNFYLFEVEPNEKPKNNSILSYVYGFCPFEYDGIKYYCRVELRETKFKGKSLYTLYDSSVYEFEEIKKASDYLTLDSKSNRVPKAQRKDNTDSEKNNSADENNYVNELKKDKAIALLLNTLPSQISKVIDEETKQPLVVYHGSNFNFTKFESTTGNYFFTSNIDVAKRYRDDFLFNEDLGVGIKSEEYDDFKDDVVPNTTPVYQCFLSLKNPNIKDYKGENWLNNPIEKHFDFSKDGFIAYNIIDGAGIVANTYVAFHPNQIKLADGTNTKFGVNNSDIRYEQGGLLIHNVVNSTNQIGNIDFFNSALQTFEKGGEITAENKELLKDWNKLINMTYSELHKFYLSDEGMAAGLSSSEAHSLGIRRGRDSAKWIMKMKQINPKNWTPKMWEWAKHQVNFVKRMSGNKGKLYDDKGNKTRKHTSLLIWGHNPEKLEQGGTVLIGGKSEGKTLKQIADMHNVSLAQISKQLMKGKKVELEHTNDTDIALRIAKDHLVESPNYYDLLEEMESKFQKPNYIKSKEDNYIVHKYFINDKEFSVKNIDGLFALSVKIPNRTVLLQKNTFPTLSAAKKYGFEILKQY